MCIENIKKLTSTEKKNGVIADYNYIAKEYAQDFFYDTSDNKYIDDFLSYRKVHEFKMRAYLGGVVKLVHDKKNRKNVDFFEDKI